MSDSLSVMGQTFDSASDEPLVSICVPTYNNGRFLAQSLASIIGQTYGHLEILVGDDGSTDDTEAVAGSFQDKRIRYHRNQRNLGQFGNVNSIISRARGRYVAVFHSDDYYEPQIVEKEAHFLEAHPEVGAVFALDKRVDHQGNLIGVTQLPDGVPTDTPLRLTDLLPVLLRHKNRVLRAPTFMGRASALAKAGGFRDDFDIAGDFDMWMRLLEQTPIAILGDHLMYYRHGRSQVSTRYNQLRTFEEHFFPIMDRYLATAQYKQGITAADLTEYAFHRADDETFRAANHVIKGEIDQARALLRRPFPWRTLARYKKRKLRVVLLRWAIRAGLWLRMTQPLSRWLIQMEYEGQSPK